MDKKKAGVWLIWLLLWPVLLLIIIFHPRTEKFYRITLSILLALIVAIIIVGRPLVVRKSPARRSALVQPTPELLIAPNKRIPTATVVPTQSALSIALTQTALRSTPTPELNTVTFEFKSTMMAYLYEDMTGEKLEPTAAINAMLAAGGSYACMNIKGNVNSNGEKIYHCPNWRDYDRTEIIESEGDRWFCSEAEARRAGFRDPLYPHGTCRP